MSENLIGLIPAAGKGKRLGFPFPKELYPVIEDNHYYPVSQYVLNNLIKAQVEHIVFVINETKHQLLKYFGDGRRFGCRMSYVVQEPSENQESSTSPGLAHALDSAYHLIQHKTVVFGMADTIMRPANVFNLCLEKANPGWDVILCLFETNYPQKFGMVHFNEDTMKVQKIIDKPAETDLRWMWGSIIWRPPFSEILHSKINDENISDFATIMNQAIQQGLNFQAVKVKNGQFFDLGTYDEIKNLNLVYSTGQMRN